MFSIPLIFSLKVFLAPVTENFSLEIIQPASSRCLTTGGNITMNNNGIDFSTGGNAINLGLDSRRLETWPN